MEPAHPRQSGGERRALRAGDARDPGYVLAWAGLADAFDLLGYYGVRPPRETFPRAKEAAAKALAIDEDLAEAHSSLAFARLLFDRRSAGGLEWLEKAREARDSWLVFLGIDPVWDGLRDDERFEVLVREVGFEEAGRQ